MAEERKLQQDPAGPFTGIFAGFTENPAPLTPQPCDPGVPADTFEYH